MRYEESMGRVLREFSREAVVELIVDAMVKWPWRDQLVSPKTWEELGFRMVVDTTMSAGEFMMVGSDGKGVVCKFNEGDRT